jgi:2-polyprenyl-3-methyl-5-hydroxy-6-metoxy-1,4-benzoquinol methylase
MWLPRQLRCRSHDLDLTFTAGSLEQLSCRGGCRIPVVRGVPRFVESANYAAGFGLQWKHFSKTQLDSDTGTTISKDRLTRCVGGSLEILRDKSVLEVGCGSGRFTEVMLAAGAKVFACDLSEAVEANYENCRGAENYFVCQADVRQLPVEPHSFEVVVCIGVIQHTPSPEETISKLSSYLKPGGLLVIDHYAPGYSQNFLQRNLRSILIRLPASVAKPLALMLARSLLPVHRLSWTNGRGSGRYRRFLLKYSPLVDYYDAYRELGAVRLSQWSVLDTHDTLTDYYKHLRTAEQISESLKSCGLVDIEVSYGGNGVEARARMPVSDER